jgi:hypothetical protein
MARQKHLRLAHVSTPETLDELERPEEAWLADHLGIKPELRRQFMLDARKVFDGRGALIQLDPKQARRDHEAKHGDLVAINHAAHDLFDLIAAYGEKRMADFREQWQRIHPGSPPPPLDWNSDKSELWAAPRNPPNVGLGAFMHFSEREFLDVLAALIRGTALCAKITEAGYAHDLDLIQRLQRGDQELIDKILSGEEVPVIVGRGLPGPPPQKSPRNRGKSKGNKRGPSTHPEARYENFVIDLLTLAEHYGHRLGFSNQTGTGTLVDVLNGLHELGVSFIPAALYRLRALVTEQRKSAKIIAQNYAFADLTDL